MSKRGSQCVPQFEYCFKGDVPPEDFPTVVINKILGVIEMPRVFIVHGHDHHAVLELKNYLQNTLGLPEPVILAEQPSKGMTLIEKFEHYAEESDLVFALFTPDDFPPVASGPTRARQNVLFEYGYFLGMMGRRAGRVFLLYKQGVEVPSDLQGLVYVDITNGIPASGEQLRRELRGLLPESPGNDAV
jgi:predicted nucleotide-binding protein